MEETAMSAALKNLKVDVKDTELRKAVRQTWKTAKKARGAHVIRCFEWPNQEIEEKLRRRDRRGFFQHLKCTEVKKTRKLVISQTWVRFCHSLLNVKGEKLDPDINFKLP